MTSEWEKLSGGLTLSDVVTWTEAIWPPNTARRRRKQKPWGKQKVIAQIIAIDDDAIHLTVLDAIIIENILDSALKPHKTGSTLIKKPQTIHNGNPMRLKWSEEDVRNLALLTPNP